MACGECQESIFWAKLGRCKTCMWQLVVLVPSSWSLWAYLYLSTPKQVESIALLFFCFATTGLLIAHGLTSLYLKLRAS
jgi:hypothetical protein